MGLFDFFRSKNKVKRIAAPDIVTRDGTSARITFSPTEDWGKKTKEEKEDSLKLYPAEDGTILINMEIPNEEGQITEVNLLRFDNNNDISKKGPGKNIKDEIIKILDQQTKKVNEKEILKRYVNLSNLLEREDVNGKLSSEGRKILKNSRSEVLDLKRTVFINRDEHGYFEGYKVKDHVKLMNKVLDLEKEDFLTKKMDTSMYSESEISDFRKGYIALCKIARNIGMQTTNGNNVTYEAVKNHEPFSTEESYKELLDTKIGREIELKRVKTSTGYSKGELTASSEEIMMSRLREELIKASLFLENVLEEYIQKRMQSNSRNMDNVELVIEMLNYAKTEVTKKDLQGYDSHPKEKSFDERIRVNLDEEGKNINLENVDVKSLVQLISYKNYKESLKNFTDEELENIAQLARDELQRRKLERDEAKRATEEDQK